VSVLAVLQGSGSCAGTVATPPVHDTVAPVGVLAHVGQIRLAAAPIAAPGAAEPEADGFRNAGASSRLVFAELDERIVLRAVGTESPGVVDPAEPANSAARGSGASVFKDATAPVDAAAAA
jgi:hypothetical protein